MKKKLIIPLIAVSILCTACGSSTESINEETASAPSEITTEDISAAAESLQETIQNEIDNIVSSYAPQEVTQSLDSLCQYFENSGLVSGERIEMAADMVGAVSGVKYKDCNVEIYQYDTDSQKYKDLVSTGSVTLEGFNVEVTPSAIHNEYVLICDEAPNKDEIISAFNSLE